MVLASALRVGITRVSPAICKSLAQEEDVVVCGRNAASAASRCASVSVRRMGAAAVAETDHAPLYPDAVLKAPETQLAKLSNGVRVATEAGAGPVASLTVSVDVGSRYESPENNGVCSVIGASAFYGKAHAGVMLELQHQQVEQRQGQEQLVGDEHGQEEQGVWDGQRSIRQSTGTLRWKSNSQQPVEAVIAAASTGKEAEIAAMGGKFSQTAEREVMTYNATVLKADVPKAMAVLADAAKVGLVVAEAVGLVMVVGVGGGGDGSGGCDWGGDRDGDGDDYAAVSRRMTITSRLFRRFRGGDIAPVSRPFHDGYTEGT
eukprot:jgi/Undpi1/4588/HiC_scaffold_18.g07942.m1